MDLLNIILWAALSVAVGASGTAQNQAELSLTKEKMHQERQENPVLSKDFQTAKTALEKAGAEKDLNTVRLGLKAFMLEIKKQSVETIVKLNDKASVPDLIKALEANQTIMSGGTETELLQQELNTAIVSALRRFTKLEFAYLGNKPIAPCFEKCPDDKVRKVIKESLDWVNEHKSVLKSDGKNN